MVGSVAGRGVVELAELKPINIQNHDNLKTRMKAKDTGIFIGKVHNNTVKTTVKSLVDKFEVLSDGVKASTATKYSKNTMASVLSMPDIFASPSKKIRLSIVGTPVVSGMSRVTSSSPRLGIRQSMPISPSEGSRLSAD